MRVFWTPWAGWGAALLVVLVVLFLLPRPVKIVTQYHERVVTRTVMKAQVAAKEGSTTTIRPDGTTVITGPAEIRTEAESSSSRSVDSTTTRVYAQSRWSVAGLAVLPRVSPSPRLAYGGSVGYRLLGPLWIEGLVVVREDVPDVGVAIRLTF